MFREVIASPAYECWFSYGECIPELRHDFLFWGATKHALSMRNHRSELGLMSPGANWLPSLPRDILGRELHGGSFAEAMGIIGDDPGALRFKLSEMKHDLLPAGLYETHSLRSILESAPELSDAHVQWTSSDLDLDYEHRFFLSQGEILTGSPYLVEGEVYHSSISWKHFAEAHRYASEMARELDAVSPPSYVLDVAWDRGNSRWIVLEANRSWSSGLYGSDPFLAMKAIGESFQKSAWDWVPDEVIESYAPTLEVAPDPDLATGLIRLGG